MNTKPEVSDEEIQSYMNFDLVLEQHKKISASTKSLRNIRNAAIGITGLVVLSALIYFSIKITTDEPGTVDTIKKQNLQPSPASTPPETKYDSAVKSNSDSPAQHAVTLYPDKSKLKTPLSTGAKQVPADSGKIESTSPIYVQAEPVDGYPALYEYFSRELTYPEAAVRDSIQGVVSVVFTIGKDGHPEKIGIEQSLGPAFDDEAIRVIKNMPLWKPATYNGKPLSSRISLPLSFQLNTIKSKE